MSETTYVELRAHTAFSFGEGACTPEALVAQAASLGYHALGVTDAADLGAVPRFALACRDHGVRPVVGVELAVDGLPIALLAESAAGYRTLGALVTRARAGCVADWRREDGGAAAATPARGRPTVPWSAIAERPDGLTLLTGPATGRLARLLRQGRRPDAARLLDRYREAFAERLAVEVQLHHAGRAEAALAGGLIRLASERGVPWVVTGDARYVDDAGRRALDVLTALRHETTIDDAAERGLLLPNDTWALQSPRAMAARWAGREAGGGLAASVAIAERCAFDLAWARPPLPKFPLPEGTEPNERLRELVEAGARERWGDRYGEKEQRQIDHELNVIRQLGFAGFFLVMHDAVQFARGRNILCQGRGSAANSAVTYCLGITAVDPVANHLLFERFLSPARADGLTEAPDIDVDVEHDRREEVLDYMYEKYGRAHAAITAVTQQYSASTAVQDVCRAYGVPTEVAFALSKRVHRWEPATGAARLREGLAAEHGLAIDTPRGAALLDAVAAFEQLPRLRSTHPGGFVLSAAPLGEYCPVEPTTMGRTIIQYDKDDLDAIGIPKYDFLGLGALSAVRRAFDVIEAYDERGRRPTLYGLPYDDAGVYEAISRGDTIGTFQIESRAQISSLVQTRPERLYDIVVQVALIRPGPIQAKFVRPYVERRHDPAEVVYPPGLAEKMKPILDRTQGIPIFQEQAMALSVALAGYSAAEADELRRTMGHQRKRPRLVTALERLYGRLTDEGVDPTVARQLVEDLMSFANYGFPESHAWSFALIAYATAWLKVRHPAAFFCGLLNAQPMGFYSVATLVHEARKSGVEIRLPCLAVGARDCTVERVAERPPNEPALRIGWRFARGFGDDAAKRLEAARADAPFASIADVVRRGGLTRADATALARAHAFAAWEPDRRRAAWEAMRAAGDDRPLAPTRADEGEPRLHPFGRHAAIAADYHALGLSVAGHPVERYRAWCRRVGVLDAAALQRCRGGERVIVAGLVVARQRPTSAKGTMFLLLEDECGQTNVVVWKHIDERHRELVRHTPFVAIYGTAEREGSLVTVIARQFKALGESEAESVEADRVTYRSRDFR